RERRVERHVALHLLNDLVDVAVQYRDRTEALQEFERARAVLRAPAPFLIDDPERDMREDDDRHAVGLAAQIVSEPGELRFAGLAAQIVREQGELPFAEIAEAAAL